MERLFKVDLLWAILTSRQLANQAVPQIPSKHANTHTKLPYKTSISVLCCTVYFIWHSDHCLWPVGGCRVGLRWQKSIYMCEFVGGCVNGGLLCLHKASGGRVREAKRQEDAGILRPNGKSQSSCCLPAPLCFSDSLHALSTCRLNHPLKTHTHSCCKHITAFQICTKLKNTNFHFNSWIWVEFKSQYDSHIRCPSERN